MKDNKKKIMISISLIVVFIFALAGISYAAFTYVGKGDIINQITTAEISMDYKESDNVISLNNALPTTDATGKTRLVDGEYFDFSVTTKIAGNTMINWEIAAEDFDDNTFDGANVKYYLTKIVDGNEVPVSEDLPKVYHEETTINKYTGRPANQMSLLVGTTSTIGVETTNYRLRLYVDENYNPQGDGGGLIYKTRINVYGLDTIYHSIKTDEGVIIDQDATAGDIVHFEVEDRPGYIYDGAEILNKDGEVIEIVPNDKKEFVMPDEEITIKIKWKGETHGISIEVVTGGSISVSDSAEYGSTVTITVNSDVGYQYDGVTITNQEGNVLLTLESNETSFEMPLADIKITPSFSKINYTITVNEITGGQITLEKSTGSIGDVIRFTTIENEGYGYNGATVSYEDQTIEIEALKKEFVMPASNVTITPKWTPLNYNITNTSVEGGRIVIAATSAYNATVSFETNADVGYEYTGATVKNALGAVIATLSASEKSFTMPSGDVTITGDFKKIDYTISKEEATGGSIIVDAKATMGSTVSFLPKSNSGYGYNGVIIKNSNGQIIATLTSTQTSFVMPASNVIIIPSFIALSVMRSYDSSSTDDYHNDTYRTKITSIETKKNVLIPSTALAVTNGKGNYWDVSAVGDDSVIAYIEDDGTGNSTYKLTIGGNGGIMAPSDSNSLFNLFYALKSIDLTYLDTSKVTNMEGMFNYCYNLTTLNLKNFNTSKVTNMGGMFYRCQALVNLDLSNFDTSNVTNMGSMFEYCTNLTSLDLSSFDTSKVKNMRFMFRSCEKLNSLDLRSFETSKETYMSYMFFECSMLTSILVSNKWTTATVDNTRMFEGCGTKNITVV